MIYDELKLSADDLIAQFGRTLSFTRITQGAYDPATGTTTDVETPYTAKAVRTRFSVEERRDSSIQVDDIKLVAEADGAYTVNDKVSIDSEDFLIVRSDPIRPADVTLAYTLQARR